MHATAIDLAGKLRQFNEHWAPRTVATFNGHDVMVAKLKGDFAWHVHPGTDDLFLVIAGSIDIDLRDDAGERHVTLGPGQLFVVPRGVQHRPRASSEAHVLLMEVTGTPNSGDPRTAAPRRVI